MANPTQRKQGIRLKDTTEVIRPISDMAIVIGYSQWQVKKATELTISEYEKDSCNRKTLFKTALYKVSHLPFRDKTQTRFCAQFRI